MDVTHAVIYIKTSLRGGFLPLWSIWLIKLLWKSYSWKTWNRFGKKKCKIHTENSISSCVFRLDKQIIRSSGALRKKVKYSKGCQYCASLGLRLHVTGSSAGCKNNVHTFKWKLAGITQQNEGMEAKSHLERRRSGWT